MPIPYMGTKRKSAERIYDTITSHNPDMNTLVDLFCGGFAISEIFIKNGHTVIANDKNKYVVALIGKIVNQGLDKAFITKFVDRELFFDVIKHNTDKYEDWYVGYVLCNWSFGNNQKDYLYGGKVEAIKLAVHKLVIDLDPTGMYGLVPTEYIDGILKIKTWQKRRLVFKKICKLLSLGRVDLQHLEGLERLQSLERLQGLKQLILHSKDYREIVIPTGAVIYCDPPYKGTREYKEKGFNYIEFWDWVRVVAKTNKIYISEYNAPADFIPLLQFKQKSTLCGGTQKHNNQPAERVFVPIGQEEFSNRLAI